MTSRFVPIRLATSRFYEGQTDKGFTLGTDRKSVYMRDRHKKGLHWGQTEKVFT